MSTPDLVDPALRGVLDGLAHALYAAGQIPESEQPGRRNARERITGVVDDALIHPSLQALSDPRAAASFRRYLRRFLAVPGVHPPDAVGEALIRAGHPAAQRT